MAHLMSESAREEIESAASEELPAAALAAAASAAATESELPPAPENLEQLLYRLGQLESELRQLREAQAVSLAVIASQEQAMAELQAETAVIEEVAVGEVEEEKTCEGNHPPAWCHLLAGQRRRS